MFYLIKLVSKLSFHPARLMEDSACDFLGLPLHRGAGTEKQELSWSSADSWNWLLHGGLEVLLSSGALVLHLRHLQNSWEAEDLSEVPEDCVISWVTVIPHIFLVLRDITLSLAPTGFQHCTFTVSKVKDLLVSDTDQSMIKISPEIFR